MKKILLLLVLSLALTGCTHKDGIFSWFTNYFGGFSRGFDSGFEVDNDGVFDLFQDDFGSGITYDDRFIDSGNGNVEVGGTDVSADGQTEYEPVGSYTFDPVYDEIGKMTPGELHSKDYIEIPVLRLGDHFFPFPDKQFGDKAGIDQCDHPHYHGDSGYTLDLKNIPEPEDPCGFDNATKIMSVTGDEMIDWFHNRPRNF